MLNRRHIRAKVFQNIYAFLVSNAENLDTQEKFLKLSFQKIHDLYLTMLSLLVELQKEEQQYLYLAAKKHLATKEEKNPNKKFVQNRIFQLLINDVDLLNKFEQRSIQFFHINHQYVLQILEAIKASEIYKEYIADKTDNFENDKEFIIKIYTDIIAPDEKIFDALEDAQLFWADDYAHVNTYIVNQVRILSENKQKWMVEQLFKDEDDEEFGYQLFKKTLLNYQKYLDIYKDKTNNWEIDRIAETDNVLLTMALCELQKFPSIPIKVTINEYLELAKEYSTPKSNIFINGVLDVSIKELKEKGLIQKSGRGLIE